ncbi:MAG: hypothetical protein H6R13_332 [Proteobacteria bacterium]|nr:hypothetical protein [Pseudomonadota bacterium]
MNSKTLLGQEWQTLQANHEQHERNALSIKLVCLALCLIGLALRLPPVWIGFTVLLCWVQEGIYKTYQSRLTERLQRIEALLGQPEPMQVAMQLHTDWAASRPGSIGLIASYILSACRPTVAFPYLPIVLMLLVGRWLTWL